MKIKSNSVLPIASSITHQHLTAVINTIIGNSANTNIIRILDLGCGNGKLLSHLLSALAILKPDLHFEFFGLDISDSIHQVNNFMKETRHFLAEKDLDIDWNKQITCITEDDKWPYQNQSFDFIISNQVMEHVMDHDFVFREIHRCLRPGGTSINLFPTREVLMEGHAHMPLVHKIKDEAKRARIILCFARIGFTRRYKIKKDNWNSLKDFAQKYSHTLEIATNYLSSRQLFAAAARSGLTISFSYTKDYFIAKLLSYIGKRPYCYKYIGVLDAIGLFFGKWLSSVTVILEKKS